jgi:adenine-specific DNA-methyltransferase
MVLNYIGSKKSLAQRLVAEIVKNWQDLNTWDLCDAFAGTGAIAVGIAPHVNSIIVNDWEPFTQHLLNAQFNPPKNTLSLVDNLNKAPPTTGAVTLTYSEAAGRLFFTTLNAQRIDGIREALRSQSYTDQERSYLIGSLVSSADSIANVASVYGAFLKDFKTSAQNLLQLKLIAPATKTATVLKMDAQLLCVDPTFIKSQTLLYLDPPYNQRQYGANYFPLNAIADIYADTLNVSGITGLPQEGYKKSGFCSKKTAHQNLTDIVKNTPAKRIALSYNNEGILSHDAIVDIFVTNNWIYKKVQIPYKRFASQKDLEPDTLEYLFLAEKIATA